MKKRCFTSYNPRHPYTLRCNIILIICPFNILTIFIRNTKIISKIFLLPLIL